MTPPTAPMIPARTVTATGLPHLPSTSGTATLPAPGAGRAAPVMAKRRAANGGKKAQSAVMPAPSKPVAAPSSLIALFADGTPYRGDITNEQYHADRSCVSVSGLKQVLRSPAHFYAYINGERKETLAMFIGTALHTKILEPEKFAETYVVAPEGDKRSKEWKEFQASHADSGKLILTAGQAQMLDGMFASVMAHKSAVTLIRGGLKEQTLVWQDEETGIWLKIRPDNLCPDFDTGVCLDLKSCEDASREAFARHCVNYGYDLQSAVYLEGLRVKMKRDFDFAFLAAEKESPYGVALYGAPEDMLRRGRRLFREALRRLKAARDTGFYGSYQPDGDYDVLDWPRWAM